MWTTRRRRPFGEPHHFGAALHTRALLDENELAAGKVLADSMAAVVVVSGVLSISCLQLLGAQED